MTTEHPVVQVARDIAYHAHVGQVDKQGRDYWTFHLAPVAELLRPYGPAAEAAGWLHDVVEDTAVTFEALNDAGMPVVVVNAVAAVTRMPGMPYMDMIRDVVALDRLATLVKLADNWVNLTGLDDLAKTDPETAARLRARYERAREYLTEALIS